MKTGYFLEVIIAVPRLYLLTDPRYDTPYIHDLKNGKELSRMRGGLISEGDMMRNDLSKYSDRKRNEAVTGTFEGLFEALEENLTFADMVAAYAKGWPPDWEDIAVNEWLPDITALNELIKDAIRIVALRAARPLGVEICEKVRKILDTTDTPDTSSTKDPEQPKEKSDKNTFKDCIITADKEKVLAKLKELIGNRTGKAAVIVIRAAMESGTLSKKPPFKTFVSEFGATNYVSRSDYDAYQNPTSTKYASISIQDLQPFIDEWKSLKTS